MIMAWLFISGGSGGGGGVTPQKTAKSVTVSPFVNVKPLNILKETTGQFQATTASLWWAVLSAAVWWALMREKKAPFSDFLDLQNDHETVTSNLQQVNLRQLDLIIWKRAQLIYNQTNWLCYAPDHIYGTQDLEKGLSSVCRIWCWGGGNNIGMLSFPKRQSQPPKTIRFLSHYRSHSLHFAPSPFLSPEVSDTEMGNNQKSAQETSNSRFPLYAPCRSFQRGGCNPNVYFPSAKVFWLTTQSLTRLALFLICPRTVVPPGHRQNLIALSSVSFYVPLKFLFLLMLHWICTSLCQFVKFGVCFFTLVDMLTSPAAELFSRCFKSLTKGHKLLYPHWGTEYQFLTDNSKLGILLIVPIYQNVTKYTLNLFCFFLVGHIC